MRPILALALKDLRVLPRIRMAFFFTFIWPVIVAVMFGYAFSGSGDGATRAMKIAVVDTMARRDRGPSSRGSSPPDTSRWR